jgi:hypothetical protein
MKYCEKTGVGSVTGIVAVSLFMATASSLASNDDESTFVMRLQSVGSASVLSSTSKIIISNLRKLPRATADQVIANAAITNRSYFLVESRWPDSQIFVCWEDDSPQFFQQRELVRQFIANSWSKYSALSFLGWGKCLPTFAGIHIQVQDDGPHTNQLGVNLDGLPNGMVLNFTFKDWSSSCQSMIDVCIRSTAVHEFGHALGFAHEQTRPDTPSDCGISAEDDVSGDKPLTPWDANSVMNYCNPVYGNNGMLSPLDIAGLQIVYGESAQ